MVESISSCTLVIRSSLIGSPRLGSTVPERGRAGHPAPTSAPTVYTMLDSGLTWASDPPVAAPSRRPSSPSASSTASGTPTASSFVALLHDFGWSRSLLAGAFSVFVLVHGLLSPGVGWLVDRIGSRRLVLAGGAGLAAPPVPARAAQRPRPPPPALRRVPA